MRLRFLLVGCLLLLAGQIKAQTDPVFSLFRLYPQVINPTFVGASDKNEIILVNRNQWTSMPGTPVTTALMGNFNWGEKFI